MSYTGLDFSGFPGLAKTAELKSATNAVWLGFYLSSPSHPYSSWSGQHDALRVQGWGLAPVYVGQQIVGPGSHNVTAAQGSTDGYDAVAKMEAEGFADGSYVYLDLENGPPFQSPQTDYVRAWCAAVVAGGFGAGIYCSHAMAGDVAAANAGARIWAFNVPTVNRTNFSGSFPTPDVSGCGYADAVIWQRADNVFLTDHNLLVDLDVSTMIDPSAPA